MLFIPLSISGFDRPFALNLSYKISDFKEDLNRIDSKSSLISFPFLQTIESCPPIGLKPFYACLKKENGEVLGFFNFQIKYFRANQSFRFGEEADVFCKIHLKLKSLVANLVEFNTLVCGNLMLTGPYGYILTNDYREYESLIYQHIIEEVQGWLRANECDTNVILVKDFFNDQRVLDESTFHSFSIQPNMILHLPMTWTSFDHYLSDLHSKYRIRAKRAFKSAEKIQKQQMNLEEVISASDQLFRLYKQTSTNADFNLIDLHPDYFKELKRNLGDSIHFYSYSLDHRLVAFFTIIEDGEADEAHFLGIEEDVNKKYQLYLNILFDIIRSSISRKKKTIRLSRTAIEIKSSVGAVPHSTTCYIKHRKVINNTFVPYLLDFLNQKNDYVLRHPFKEPAEILGKQIKVLE